MRVVFVRTVVGQLVQKASNPRTALLIEPILYESFFAVYKL